MTKSYGTFPELFDACFDKISKELFKCDEWARRWVGSGHDQAKCCQLKCTREEVEILDVMGVLATLMLNVQLNVLCQN
ncbi:unnamed protein product [Medioppia subpectinata]|uniref:Uncharacterized protein n=1 Tax=Medioppia subpectinata TaxID=1979941 RepID=A0A7R9KXU0_9ACAR|nr:unnamed protein product [Medioppia subpectinata]CAG2110718.1 unnamed protein product [Medioppia subpectinata]